MKTNRSVFKRNILCYLSLLLCTVPVAGFAEEAESTYSFDEIVVTANRMETPHKEVTSTVSVITREMIENSTAATLQDLLTIVPGVASYNEGGGGLGSKAGVSIRGLDGGTSSYRMLLLIDGRPANNGFQAAIDWNTIPLANIERIEVVRGPVSAMYGDSSLGGAVNIITRKYAKDGGVVETSFGSFQTFTTSLLQQGRLKDGGDFTFTANYGSTDGFRDHSDYEGKNATLRLNMANGITFSSGYTQYDRTNPGTVGVPKPTGDATVSPYDSYDFDNVEGYYFDLSKEIKSGIHTTKISSYYEVLDSSNVAEWIRSNKRYYVPPVWALSNVLKEKTFGIQLNQNVTISDKQRLTWGFDYRLLKADGWSNNGKTVWNPAAPPSANESAIYVQNSQKIAEKLTMDIGGRYDHHSDYGGQFNPKFGLAYAADADTTLKLNIARAFRAPTLNDLYGKNSWPDLQPERSWNYELGLEQRFDEKTKGSITLYKADVKDLIVGNNRSISGHKDNQDRMRAQGVELELTRDMNAHVDFFVNYTYLDVGEMTRRASEHKGNLGVNYKNGAFKASLFEQYVGSSYVEDLAINTTKLGGYALTNMKFTFAPQESDYSYALTVNNLFDKNYEKFEYYPMPGRSYTFTVKKKF